VPTLLKFQPRPSRTKTAIDSALPFAQRFLMMSAAVIVVLILAQINASSTASAIRAGQLPVISTYLP
jgi:hypothetical protein